MALVDFRERATPARLLRILPTRPETRGDCLDVPRPCPFVACRHHLFLDVRRDGQIEARFPGREPSDLAPDASCALDVADLGPRGLKEIAAITGTSHQAVHQAELRGLRAIRPALEAIGLDGSDWWPGDAAVVNDSGGLSELHDRRIERAAVASESDAGALDAWAERVAARMRGGRRLRQALREEEDMTDLETRPTDLVTATPESGVHAVAELVKEPLTYEASLSQAYMPTDATPRSDADVARETVETDLEYLTSLLCRFRVRVANESDLSSAVEKVLADAGLAFEREKVLSPRCRADFALNDIVLELKVAGSIAEVLRQVAGYASLPSVAGVLIVTTRYGHRALDRRTVAEKPLRVCVMERL